MADRWIQAVDLRQNTFQKQTGGQENVQGLGSVQCGFSIGRGEEMAEMFFGTERFQDMENGERWDPERSKAGQIDLQRHLTILGRERKSRWGHIPNF